MSERKSTSSGGIGFVGLLTIAFIVLKLTAVIDWNWLWVLAPIWAAFGLVIALLVVAAWAEDRSRRSLSAYERRWPR